MTKTDQGDFAPPEGFPEDVDGNTTDRAPMPAAPEQTVAVADPEPDGPEREAYNATKIAGPGVEITTPPPLENVDPDHGAMKGDAPTPPKTIQERSYQEPVLMRFRVCSKNPPVLAAEVAGLGVVMHSVGAGMCFVPGATVRVVQGKTARDEFCVVENDR